MTQAEEIQELRGDLANLRAQVELLHRREDRRHDDAKADARLSGMTEVELREMKLFRDEARGYFTTLLEFRKAAETLIQFAKYVGGLSVTLLVGFAINGLISGIRLEQRVQTLETRAAAVEDRLGAVEKRLGDIEVKLTKMEAANEARAAKADENFKAIAEALKRLDAGQKK